VLAGLILALFGYHTWLHCSDLRDNQTLWRTVLKADPKSWYASMNLSVELGQAGKLDEAETLARTAVQLGREEPETNLNLVSIIGLRNREKEALNVATNAAARFPKISAFPLVEGKLSARLGQMEQAADYFALALDLNPGDSVIFLCLADSLKQLNKPERLIAPTKRYLLLNPDDSDAWTYLGMACAVTGRRMEAESCFLKALEFSKDKAAALENLEMLRKMPSN